MRVVSINRIFLTILLLTVLSGIPAVAADALMEKGVQSIMPFDVYGFCKKLSGPEFEGRQSGTEAYDRAAQWVAQQFEAWGLEKIPGEGSFLPPQTTACNVIDSASLTLFMENEEPMELKLERQFLPNLSSAPGKGKGKLVFVGWGISAPELGYDDYAGIDAKGKYVVCFQGTPDRKNEAYAPYTSSRKRLETAREKGALGVLICSSRIYGSFGKDYVKGIPVAKVSSNVIDRVFKEKDTDTRQVLEKLRTDKKPFSFELKTEAQLAVSSKYRSDAPTANVVAMIKGSDPKLSKECVVIGAHLDHMGKHAGLIFAGAHDNAAGCAAVMAIAKAFAQLPERPKRSVVFALFNGEEKGLVGSRYLAEHLPSKFEKVSVMMNFELCGIGSRINCAVSSKHETFRAACQSAASVVEPLKVGFLERSRGFSDHVAFDEQEIPNMCITAGGPHDYYHRSGDTFYVVNPDIMGAVAKFTFSSAWKIANL